MSHVIDNRTKVHSEFFSLNFSFQMLAVSLHSHSSLNWFCESVGDFLHKLLQTENANGAQRKLLCKEKKKTNGRTVTFIYLLKNCVER